MIEVALNVTRNVVNVEKQCMAKREGTWFQQHKNALKFSSSDSL